MTRHRPNPLLGCVVLGMMVLTSCASSSEPTGLAESSAQSDLPSGLPFRDGDDQADDSLTPADDSGTPAEDAEDPLVDDDAERIESGPRSSADESPSTDDAGLESHASYGDTETHGDAEPCAFDQLQVKVARSESRRVDNSTELAITLKFANISAQSCTVAGAPDVSIISVAGDKQHSVADTASAGEHDAITLTPGEYATSDLLLRSANDDCDTVTQDGLLVFPPGSPNGSYLPKSVTLCAGDAPASVRATSFTAAH